MSKAGKRTASELEGSELFSDQDFDLSDFIDTMEIETAKRSRSRIRSKASKTRMDDLDEARWLRSQLLDWDD